MPTMPATPTVVAVMVTANRPELAKRAVQAFRAQTYPAKRLMVFNSGPIIGVHDLPIIAEVGTAGIVGWSIAELRNMANVRTAADIIVHFDDDDWSPPNRIAEQVALLQAGADLVGYTEMLFWRDASAPHALGEEPDTWGGGQAWLYTGDILGTSMAYWRKTWERVPFQVGGHHNEDAGFALGVRAAGMRIEARNLVPEALMIARIHAGNAQNPSYDPAQMAAHPHHWQRVPAWDDYARKIMDGEKV